MVPSILPLCHGCNIGKANQLLKVGGNTIAVRLYHSLSLERCIFVRRK